MAVTFHGPFGDGDRSKVYGTFDVLVVPSIWPENSPFVVHEAFLARRPVIAARMGGLPELVADGVCGRLYEATSAAELAAAIEELLATPGTLRRWIQAIPPVKSLDDDVQEWEARYRTFVGRRTPVEQPA